MPEPDGGSSPQYIFVDVDFHVEALPATKRVVRILDKGKEWKKKTKITTSCDNKLNI